MCTSPRVVICAAVFTPSADANPDSLCRVDRISRVWYFLPRAAIWTFKRKGFLAIKIHFTGRHGIMWLDALLPLEGHTARQSTRLTKNPQIVFTWPRVAENIKHERYCPHNTERWEFCCANHYGCRSAEHFSLRLAQLLMVASCIYSSALRSQYICLSGSRMTAAYSRSSARCIHTYQPSQVRFYHIIGNKHVGVKFHMASGMVVGKDQS